MKKIMLFALIAVSGVVFACKNNKTYRGPEQPPTSLNIDFATEKDTMALTAKLNIATNVCEFIVRNENKGKEGMVIVPVVKPGDKRDVKIGTINGSANLYIACMSVADHYVLTLRYDGETKLGYLPGGTIDINKMTVELDNSGKWNIECHYFVAGTGKVSVKSQNGEESFSGKFYVGRPINFGNIAPSYMGTDSSYLFQPSINGSLVPEDDPLP